MSQTTMVQISAAELEALRAKAAKSDKPQKITLKVGKSGALSIYGLQRFPVTLYKGQWLKVAEIMPQIQEFIKANAAALKEKE